MPPLARPATLRGILSPTTTTTPLTSATTWTSRLPPSTRRSVATIPPESPRYIQVPKPKQSEGPPAPRIRGHLPVPREVFPKHGGERLVAGSYIRKIMPRSNDEMAGRVPTTPSGLRRRADANSRRKALSAGLRGLWERKQEKEERVQRLSKRAGDYNRQKALAPERMDDVLTRGTVRLSTAVVTAVELDPDRMVKAEAARARHAEIMAAKAEARRDALAQLYVAASDFIVDEAELAEKVAEKFDPNHPKYKLVKESQTIWDQGIPMSVAEASGRMSSAATTMFARDLDGTLSKTTKRQKKVAEELTGGKL